MTPVPFVETLNQASMEFAFHNVNIMTCYIKAMKQFYPYMIDSIYRTAMHEYLYEHNYEYFIEVLVEQCSIQGITDVESDEDYEYFNDLIAINAEVIDNYGVSIDDVIDDVCISLRDLMSKERQDGEG